MKYLEYKVVPVKCQHVNGVMLKKSFVTLGIAQFTVKVKTESKKYIYIIPAKYSCQYLSSIVMALR